MENGTAGRRQAAKRRRKDGRMICCLIYPNRREVGLSNLGFQKIYAALNDAGAECDMAFIPAGRSGKILSEKLRKPLSAFDLLAFSVTFEMDELNVLEILHKSGIPLNSGERDDKTPLVCAGGVAVTLNPEPLSTFIDFFVIGEGETIIEKIVSELGSNPGRPREERLKSLASIESVYIPSLYEVGFDDEGRAAFRTAKEGVPEKVKRSYNPDYSRFGMAQLKGLDGSVFGDAYLIETGKGCGQGCRFCATGFVYRPVRHVNAEVLKRQVAEGLKDHRRIGLVGSAICEHPEIDGVFEHILKAGGELTVSSLRIGLTSREMFERLARGGCRTISVAPEAGSERLRRSINKEITDEEILDTLKDAVTAGIPNVKTYFLIGLPNETENDVGSIAKLVGNMREVFIDASRPFGRAGKITVSLNPFVPKPFTPFQWEPMAPINELRKKTRLLARELGRLSNVEFKMESLKTSAAQALLSVGSRRVGRMLLDVFNGGNWNEILKSDEAKKYYLRKKLKDEILPWDFIDSGVDRDYLWEEYEKSKECKTTSPCLPEGSGCTRCGVFKGICC